MEKEQHSFSLLVMMFIAFIICVSQCLVACSPNQPLHQTYSYQGPAGFDNVVSQKNIPVVWKPKPGPTTSATHPDPILLKAELVGPFKTIDALLTAVRQSMTKGSFDSQLIAATASPLTVDTWTNRTLISYIPIASTLKPGCYDLNYMIMVQSASGSTSTRSDTPVKIHLPDNVGCSGTA